MLTTAAIEIYDTPTQYPVPKRKPWGRLASALALLLMLATIGLIAAGIFVQRL
jgi:hypothetical protein